MVADELFDELVEVELLDDKLLTALDEELLFGSPFCTIPKLPGAAVNATPSEKVIDASVVP
jgi:hypothetical protein